MRKTRLPRRKMILGFSTSGKHVFSPSAESAVITRDSTIVTQGSAPSENLVVSWLATH
jgi:hypothetical protein